MIRNLLIGVLLSALFLWLAFRDVDLGHVKATVLAARWEMLALSLVPTLASFAVRAWRWRYLLITVKPVPFRPLFSSMMIGFMANNVFPARLGEVLRAYTIGRRAGISRSAAMASIVVERVFDTLVLLLLFGIARVTHRLPDPVRVWGSYLVWVSIPISILLVALQLWPDWTLRILRRLAPGSLRPRVESIGRNFLEGLGVLRRGDALLAAALTSLLMWAALVVVVGLCFAALAPLGLTVPPAAAFVVLVTMAIGTMIPSAPGFVGTLQYAGTVALLPYGVSREVALAFTILYHVSQWVPTSLIGLWYFLREQLRFSELPSFGGRPAGTAQVSGNPDREPIERDGGRSARSSE